MSPAATVLPVTIPRLVTENLQSGSSCDIWTKPDILHKTTCSGHTLGTSQLANLVVSRSYILEHSFLTPSFLKVSSFLKCHLCAAILLGTGDKVLTTTHSSPAPKSTLWGERQILAVQCDMMWVCRGGFWGTEQEQPVSPRGSFGGFQSWWFDGHQFLSRCSSGNEDKDIPRSRNSMCKEHRASQMVHRSAPYVCGFLAPGVSSLIWTLFLLTAIRTLLFQGRIPSYYVDSRSHPKHGEKEKKVVHRCDENILWPRDQHEYPDSVSQHSPCSTWLLVLEKLDRLRWHFHYICLH